MKFMFISDLQAHAYAKYPETNADGVNLRLLDTVNELLRLRELATKNHVDVLFVLGDIFEARNRLDVSVLNAVYASFYDFTSHGIRVVLLVGNHDRTDVGNEHALTVFSSFCTVIDQPTTLPFEEGDIVAIPFHPRPRIVSKYLHKLYTPRTKIVLLHTAVKTLRLPTGNLWGEGIALEDIPSQPYTLIGHYHKFTQLLPEKAWYLGSMIQVDQSDASTTKYFGVYDSTKARMMFIPTQGPRFVAIDIPDFGEETRTMLTPIVEGNFVTVRTIPSLEDRSSLQEVYDFLTPMQPRHIEMSLQTQLPHIPPFSETNAYGRTVPMEIITTYVDDTETDLNKQQLIDTAVKVIERVAPQALYDVQQNDAIEISSIDPTQEVTDVEVMI